MTEATTIDHIESRALALAEPMAVAVIDPAKAFLPVPWELIEEAAALISSCPGVAVQFSDPANCRFVAYQAARWGMDPIAVATKTYFTPRKGGDKAGLLVGYEAQLIHALVETDPQLEEPLDFIYGYADPKKTIAGMRFVKVVGKLRGSAKPRILTTPTVMQVKVKNSPLWFSDPDQQLAYYGARAWARRFRPGRILGVYAKDEMENMRDVTPAPGGESLFEEEDAFTGIPPTEQETKAAERAETSTANDAGPPPPQTGDNKPAGLDDIKAWAEAERLRIVALKDIAAIAAAGDAMVSDRRFKRLIAYDQGEATRIDRSIKNRIAELEAE